MGAGLIYAEMVSDKALVYSSKKTEDMLYMEECERPIAQQIFGSDKESFVISATYIYETMKLVKSICFLVIKFLSGVPIFSEIILFKKVDTSSSL